MRLLSLALCCTCLMLATQATAQDQPPPPSDPSLQSPHNPSPSQQESEAADIAARCQTVLDAMAFRQIAPRSPIQCGYLTKDQLYARMLEMLSEDNSDQEIAHEAMLLAQLGLLSPRMDYKAFLVALLSEQVIGFYDQRAKELFLVEGQALDSLEEIMSHELFHALQDQHFGLEALRDGGDQNSDLAAARTALLEGDAFAVLFDYALPFGLSFTDVPNIEQSIRAALEASADFEGGQMLAKAPLFMAQSLIFPYLEGLVFVGAIKRLGGWDAVNAVYADPPSSTEQILHPERYLQRDHPTAIHFDLPPSEKKKKILIEDDVFGELSCILYLQQHALEQGLSLDWLQACDGWDGDRSLGTYDEATKELVFVQLSVWDRVEDAVDFVDAHQQVWLARFPEAVLRENTTQAVLLETASQCLWAERRGTEVLLIEGLRPQTAQPPAERSEELRRRLRSLVDTAWNSRRHSEYPKFSGALEDVQAEPGE